MNFCPTGMIPTKTMTPHVPLSPAEVVEDACRAINLQGSLDHAWRTMGEAGVERVESGQLKAA